MGEILAEPEKIEVPLIFVIHNNWDHATSSNEDTWSAIIISFSVSGLQGKTLERLRSARNLHKSHFPKLFSNLFRTEKSANNFDLSKISADILVVLMFFSYEIWPREDFSISFYWRAAASFSLLHFFSRTVLQSHFSTFFYASKKSKRKKNGKNPLNTGLFRMNFYNMRKFFSDSK